jgi:hypothetical protein
MSFLFVFLGRCTYIAISHAACLLISAHILSWIQSPEVFLELEYVFLIWSVVDGVLVHGC